MAQVGVYTQITAFEEWSQQMTTLVSQGATYSFQNITCQAEQVAPKVYLPHQHFHLPCHSFTQR